MASIRKRSWVYEGVKHTAYGFSIYAKQDGAGKRVRRQFPTRAEAQSALDAFKDELKRPKAAVTPKTFAEVAERYKQHKGAKKSIAEDMRILAHLVEWFGKDRQIATVTASLVDEYDQARAAAVSERTKARVGAASRNRDLAVLRAMLRLAKRWGYIAEVPEIHLHKEPEGRVRWLEPDEEARLLAACRESKNAHLADIVTVALESGMRYSEIMGLTWDRVDLSRGVVRLEKTKSGRRREVPMRQAVYAVLAQGAKGAQSGRVWPERSIRTAFENAVTEAGLDDVHFHDCRHHFASWFIMRGGSLQALQRILGHQDVKLTLRYAHLSPEHLRAEVEKTDRGHNAAAWAQGGHKELNRSERFAVTA
jgi:integrase